MSLVVLNADGWICWIGPTWPGPWTGKDYQSERILVSSTTGRDELSIPSQIHRHEKQAQHDTNRHDTTWELQRQTAGGWTEEKKDI